MKIETSENRIERELEKLKEFTSTPGRGCTRLPFSSESEEAVKYLEKEMIRSGLKVKKDGAGNIFGILEGQNPDLPVVMMGSHYDSVYNGGDYDGIAGIVCGIETARLIKERGIKPLRSFVVAGFNDEEGMRFGTGYFGSGAVLGLRDSEYLTKYKDKDGISIFSAMEKYGLIPSDIENAKWKEGSIGNYLEIHIEQGPVLYRQGIDIGLVNCIVGIQRYFISVYGRADHAGTTPMDLRIDPVEAMTRVASKIPEWAREHGEGTVATVGYVNTVPGGINIIAEKAEFTVDIRSSANEKINDIADKIRKELEKEISESGVTFEMTRKLYIEPVDLCSEMLSFLEERCTSSGISHRYLPSGAGHDCLEMAQYIPSVLLFVPSKDGRSHCPEEYTGYRSFAVATHLMTDLAVKLISES